MGRVLSSQNEKLGLHAVQGVSLFSIIFNQWVKLQTEYQPKEQTEKNDVNISRNLHEH